MHDLRGSSYNIKQESSGLRTCQIIILLLVRWVDGTTLRSCGAHPAGAKGLRRLIRAKLHLCGL